MPFDWRTPFGYLLSWIFECAQTYSTLLCCVPNIGVTIGICWLLISILKDITSELHALKIDRQSQSSRIKLKRRFCKILHHYSVLPQLSKKLHENTSDFNVIGFFLLISFLRLASRMNEMTEFTILMLFLWTVANVTSSLLILLALWVNHFIFLKESKITCDANWVFHHFLQSKPTELIPPFFIVLLTFAIIFSVCECGERVTHQSNTFNYELSQCDWYLMPIEVQRLLVVFMAYTQQPLLLRGYGNIVCTRDAFKSVSILFSLENRLTLGRWRTKNQTLIDKLFSISLTVSVFFY